MRRIDLETGDITTNKRVFFHLIKDDNVCMGDSKEVLFPTDQWSLLLDQIDDAFNSYKSWWDCLFSGFDRSYRIRNLKNYAKPPLGLADMKKVLNNSLVSTPTYQLFLASIDLTDKFLFEKNDDKYNAKCLVSVGRVYSRLGGNGVFLIDNEWLGDGTEELLDGNRLCKVVFDKKTVRYYIPYAVPFKPELSKEASKSWDKIRDRYYSMR